jgi:hypothetical protein
MDKIETRSRSTQAADATPIVLREGSMTRLVFVPMIVQNPDEQAASVKGTFVYQKKNRKDEWTPVETLSLGTLKAGDEFKLELSSHETYLLRKGLHELAQLHAAEGIPQGRKSFVKATPGLAALLGLAQPELSALLSSDADAAIETLGRMLRWIGESSNPKSLAEALTALPADALPSATSLLNLATLKQAVATWEANRSNSNERYWQDLLARQTAVLSQLFAYPVVVIKEQPYLGGKAVDNRGGKIGDFLAKAATTGALLIIEIKTPSTKLLGSEYRDGVRPISPDLSGAIAQALHYRQSVTQEFYKLMKDEEEPITLGDVRCVVIAGDASRELTNSADRNSFELLRESLKGVVVVTFDELFARAHQVVGLIETPVSL